MAKAFSISLILFLSSCASIDSVQNQIYTGMSKESFCDKTIGVILTQDPCYAHINYLYKVPNSFYQYNKEVDTEILGVAGKYFVFKNVKYKVSYPEFPPKNGGQLLKQTTDFNLASSIARTGAIATVTNSKQPSQSIREERLAAEKEKSIKYCMNQYSSNQYLYDQCIYNIRDELSAEERHQAYAKFEINKKSKEEEEEVAAQQKKIDQRIKDKERELAKKEKELEEKEKSLNEDEAFAEEAAEIIETVQAFLYSLGYAPGEEGIFDFRTQTAIKAFQTDQGIKPVDGEISEALFIRLQSAYSKKQKTLDFNDYDVTGTGSGYLVDDIGHIVTNHHVIEECSIITIGKNNLADAVRSDPANDIAIIKAENTDGYQPLSFARNDPALGQRIFVSGFPLNQILENLNFTSGTVSVEVGLFQNINQFQFTAPIQPGNSGGPIFNENGGVVGMSVASASNQKFEELVDTLVQNINFGIRQSSVRSLLDQERISYETGNPNWFKGEESVAEQAKSGTFLIKCWNPIN